jgi:hypothetical protein
MFGFPNFVQGRNEKKMVVPTINLKTIIGQGAHTGHVVVVCAFVVSVVEHAVRMDAVGHARRILEDNLIGGNKTTRVGIT